MHRPLTGTIAYSNQEQLPNIFQGMKSPLTIISNQHAVAKKMRVSQSKIQGSFQLEKFNFEEINKTQSFGLEKRKTN